MNGPEDTPTVAYAGVPNFQLTPPQVITPVSVDAASTAVPLKPEAARAVDAQVTRFIEALGTEAPDSARVPGDDEIAHAAELMQGCSPQPHFIGAAEPALGEIRSRLDALNPAHESDLLAPQKLFGVIPLGNKLKAYLRRFESTGIALQTSIVKLQAAREGVQKDINDIEARRNQLWEAMQQLAAAARFASLLDSRLSESALPMAQQLRLHARQSLVGILAQQAVCVNAYLALDALKKAGREWMNGCSRIETTLANLIREAARPMPGIEQIQELFGQTCKALDAMDTFRTKAIEALAQNAPHISRCSPALSPPRIT